MAVGKYLFTGLLVVMVQGMEGIYTIASCGL